MTDLALIEVKMAEAKAAAIAELNRSLFASIGTVLPPPKLTAHERFVRWANEMNCVDDDEYDY